MFQVRLLCVFWNNESLGCPLLLIRLKRSDSYPETGARENLLFKLALVDYLK